MGKRASTHMMTRPLAELCPETLNRTFGCQLLCNESPKVVTPIGNNSHTLRFSKSRIARSWIPPKTGPIPGELLEPALYFSGMRAQDSRTLPRSCEWEALTSRNSQVVFLSEFGETSTWSRLTTDDIAMAFNISADNAHQIRHRVRMKKKEPHDSRAFHPDQEADIVRLIRKRFGSQNYAAQRDALNYRVSHVNCNTGESHN
jgi:hypothetical protein